MHIDNSPLIEAVKRLKAKGVIRRDSEVAEVMGYSKGVVSEYLNNKKPVSELFLIKFSEKFPQANIQRGDMGKENGGTPVYDIDATAGGNLDFSNQLPETIKGYINLPNFKKCIAFITVRGDSMYPKFRAGDLIGIEPLEDMDIIQWGQVYVVLTLDNQRVLKYVRKGKDEDHFVLKSENPNYDDMLLSKNKVRKLFMAKGPVRDDWQ